MASQAGVGCAPRAAALAAAVDRELGPGRLRPAAGGLHSFATEPPAPYLRLTFAAQPPERIGAAVATLGSLRG